MKVLTIRVSATAFDDHFSRLYGYEFTEVDGKVVPVYPAIHNDDCYNRDRGLPTLGQEIHHIVERKTFRFVTLTEAAVTEMLSDFDFYTSEAMRGEYEPALVRSMRAAAVSIRKQLTILATASAEAK